MDLVSFLLLCTSGVLMSAIAFATYLVDVFHVESIDDKKDAAKNAAACGAIGVILFIFVAVLAVKICN
jgi:hypothetical protein